MKNMKEYYFGISLKAFLICKCYPRCITLSILYLSFLSLLLFLLLSPLLLSYYCLFHHTTSLLEHVFKSFLLLLAALIILLDLLFLILLFRTCRLPFFQIFRFFLFIENHLLQRWIRVLVHFWRFGWPQTVIFGFWGLRSIRITLMCLVLRGSWRIILMCVILRGFFFFVQRMEITVLLGLLVGFGLRNIVLSLLSQFFFFIKWAVVNMPSIVSVRGCESTLVISTFWLLGFVILITLLYSLGFGFLILNSFILSRLWNISI